MITFWSISFRKTNLWNHSVVLWDPIDDNNIEHSLVLDTVDKVQDGRATGKYDHIQVSTVCHKFDRTNAELAKDQIEDRSLFDNNKDNVSVFPFDRILFDILD